VVSCTALVASQTEVLQLLAACSVLYVAWSMLHVLLQTAPSTCYSPPLAMTLDAVAVPILQVALQMRSGCVCSVAGRECRGLVCSACCASCVQ
jgi:hypothetical protein